MPLDVIHCGLHLKKNPITLQHFLWLLPQPVSFFSPHSLWVDSWFSESLSLHVSLLSNLDRGIKQLYYFGLKHFYLTWNSLVKMSNSNTEMWSLQVRSIVDLRAMDSIPSSNVCTFCSFSLKVFHCTMHLLEHNIHVTTCDQLEEITLSFWKKFHKLVAKELPPKLASLRLVHPISVTLKRTIWKHGLQLPQNVAEQ